MVMFSLNRLTYHRRLFLGLVVYSLVLVTGFAILQYYREKESKAEELNGRLQLVNDIFLRGIERGDSLPELEKLILDSFCGLRISVIDYMGRIAYDNTLPYEATAQVEPGVLASPNHLSRKEVADAIRKGEGFDVRRNSELTDNAYFYSAKKGERYIVRSAVPYTVSLTGLLSADFTFMWFLALISMVMCVIGYYATRRLGQHVSRLNRFAEQAERGERIFDTEPFPHDELGDISSHIVRLYARLQQAVSDRDREHRAALHEQQEKIRIKRQLTNNINHELKTPVAAMKLCLETLMSHKDLASDRRDDFIRRCYAANERLGRLLADVSAITRMEDGGDSIARETVDAGAVVAEVCSEYELIAEEKAVTLDNGIACGTMVTGNAELLASVFRNLVDNALAYSEGDRIELRCQDSGDDVGILTFGVADNGCGVAPEHLSRLFERFYRVDKGRSRRVGGTGLGLSIVRNAVVWHGGDIRVENRSGGGLVFTFTLRK